MSNCEECGWPTEACECEPERSAGSLKRVVGTPGEYCETVEEALAAGWLKPYEGGLAADGWKGRIYGRRPGNHRIFRCTRRPNDQAHSTAAESDGGAGGKTSSSKWPLVPGLATCIEARRAT